MTDAFDGAHDPPNDCDKEAIDCDKEAIDCDKKRSAAEAIDCDKEALDYAPWSRCCFPPSREIPSEWRPQRMSEGRDTALRWLGRLQRRR